MDDLVEQWRHRVVSDDALCRAVGLPSPLDLLLARIREEAAVTHVEEPAQAPQERRCCVCGKDISDRHGLARYCLDCSQGERQRRRSLELFHEGKTRGLKRPAPQLRGKKRLRRPDNFMDVALRWSEGDLTVRHASDLLNVSSWKFHDWLREDGIRKKNRYPCRFCAVCGQKFRPTTGRQKRCPSCLAEHAAQYEARQAARMERIQARELARKTMQAELRSRSRERAREQERKQEEVFRPAPKKTGKLTIDEAAARIAAVLGLKEESSNG